MQAHAKVYAKVYEAFPNASDEDWKTFIESRRLSERSWQEGREYLEEQEERIRSRGSFYRRIATYGLENEDDDKTLILGTERQEEAFRTCSEPDLSAE
jgi:hypothetical protein